MNNAAAARIGLNLRLRPLEPGDALLYRRLYTSPEVMAHLGGPLALAHADACFRMLMARRGAGDRHYAVLQGADDQACGIGAIVPVPGDAHTAELGVMLLPGFWHRGLGEAVLILLAEVAFVRSTCENLRVQYACSNARFARLARRVGFESAWSCVGNSDAEGRISARLARSQWDRRRQHAAGE